MDANGCLWNAQWGGSRVVQYAPDGSVKEIIGLPTSQPTSCAFVGSHLLVTTASIGLEEDSFAGLTFLIPVGVEGASISYPDLLNPQGPSKVGGVSHDRCLRFT